MSEELKPIAKLTTEELEELTKLYDEYRNTPHFGLTTRQMLSGDDYRSVAMRKVAAKMRELGEKYGFDPKKAVFMRSSGAIYSTGDQDPYEWRLQHRDDFK